MSDAKFEFMEEQEIDEYFFNRIKSTLEIIKILVANRALLNKGDENAE